MRKTLVCCLSIIFAIVMVSCLEEPGIYRLLPAEDAAAIPYQVGDQFSMVNQDGDTIDFIVTYDSTQVYKGYYLYCEFADDTKTSVEPVAWCYGRTVQARSYADNVRLKFTVLLDKNFDFIWNNWGFTSQLKGTTQTVTINGTTYDNVFLREDYNTTIGEPLYQWYYSEKVGLISVKHGDLSLSLLP